MNFFGIVRLNMMLLLFGSQAFAQDKEQQRDEIGIVFKDGFKFKSSDGNFEGHIGGRVIEHARFLFDRSDGTRTSPDTFFIRQARFEMSGMVYKDYEFKVQIDFPSSSTSSTTGTIQDGYLGWKKYPEFSLRFGQFKEPFSQEETTSTRFIDFVERSNLNRLAPARDIGIMAHGKVMEGLIQYELGIFNGQGRAVVDGNDEKDLSARMWVSPFKTQDILKNLRLGLMGTWGDQDGRAFLDVTSTETATTFLDIDTSVVIDGMVKRSGVELSWLINSFSLRAEFVDVIFDLRKGAVEKSVNADAWYLALTYLLTGEDKPLENRVVPKDPFDPSQGKLGAVELALRMGGLKYDDEIFDSGFASGAGNTNNVTGITGGINWYLTRNFRVAMNYIHHKYKDDVSVGLNKFDSENGVLMRFQIDF